MQIVSLPKIFSFTLLGPEKTKKTQIHCTFLLVYLAIKNFYSDFGKAYIV